MTLGLCLSTYLEFEAFELSVTQRPDTVSVTRFARTASATLGSKRSRSPSHKAVFRRGARDSIHTNLMNNLFLLRNSKNPEASVCWLQDFCYSNSSSISKISMTFINRVTLPRSFSSSVFSMCAMVSVKFGMVKYSKALTRRFVVSISFAIN